MKSIKQELLLKYMILIFVICNVVAFVATSVSKDVLMEHIQDTQIKSNLDIFKELVKSEYGQINYVDGELLIENKAPIRENYEIVDKMGELTEDVFTIFVAKGNDFERISTNIKNAQGNRAIGTMLGTDSKAYSTIVQGNTYIGTADILGEKYVTGYDPIKADGKVVGISSQVFLLKAYRKRSLPVLRSSLFKLLSLKFLH